MMGNDSRVIFKIRVEQDISRAWNKTEERRDLKEELVVKWINKQSMNKSMLLSIIFFFLNVGYVKSWAKSRYDFL